MKTLKICLVILCLLHVRAVGLPRFSGANFFMKRIKINSPKYGIHYALIDDIDYQLISQFNWIIAKKPTTFYAYTSNCPHKAMHRIILGLGKSKLVVDHRNNNGLDNRRENIRTCSQKQNVKNNRTPITNTTGYRGVYKCKTTGRFHASIHLNDKKIHIGSFKTKEHAAMAYNKAAIRHHKEFAKINEISCVDIQE